jgi:peptide/nickel transport system permease protein
MTGFIIRRLFQAVILIKCVLVFIFMLLHLTGDPVMVMAPDDATQEDIARLRKQMGFDKPILEQYRRFFFNALKGDFGESFEHGEPALKIVLEHLPATIQLAAVAFMISIFVGIPLGCVAALKENSLIDKGCMVGAVLGQAIPNFWLGLMMILVFAVYWGALPSFGRGTLAHLIMPAIATASGRITL